MLPSRFLLHSRLVRAIFACLGFLFGATAVPAVVVRIDIPKLPATEALQRFIKQSGAQVVFSTDRLQGVKANAVKGEMEATAALEQLLANTGFKASETAEHNFVVKEIGAPRDAAGAVKGSLTGQSGVPVEGATVVIHETGQAVRTRRNGEFLLTAVQPGTYLLVITAEGYQPLHVTDVVVKANTEVTLSTEALRPRGGLVDLEPFVVRAETIEQLDKLEVQGARGRPFSDANVDIHRTIDDVQPYVIFDSTTIDRSAALNIEDFLKQRLTMNTTAQTNAQTGGRATAGNTSAINLRGVGTDKTLILVNGRRMAGVNLGGVTDNQPDLNGIPLAAIDRIEVLPSSASGIYGGSAIGGVVNVILKTNYVGGEVRASYDNTFDTDAPTRSVSANYGFSLEGGKTHVVVNAAWSRAQPLLLQDRRGIFAHNIAVLLQNSPNFFYSSINPAWLGALPNISPNSASQTTLTLDNGAVINSRNTYIAAGTSNATSNADLYSSLLANGGRWNMDLPATTQAPTGLLNPLTVESRAKSFGVSIRRQFLPSLEIFADFNYTENRSLSIFNPFTAYVTVPASAVDNPFTTAVQVRFPEPTAVPDLTRSVNRTATVGAIAHLPAEWTAELDYTFSQNQYTFENYSPDLIAFNADVANSVINPFVDTLRYPLALRKYLAYTVYNGKNQLQDIALRGSGPLWSLPWGTPNLTVGLERRLAHTPQRTNVYTLPIMIADSSLATYFARNAVTDSQYAETSIPLIKQARWRGLYALELQGSGRHERFTVDTGTPNSGLLFNVPGAKTTYTAPTLNGQPYFSRTSYDSTNYTVGLKVQPVRDVILRVSEASAFLPPSPSQLVKNPVQSTTTTLVNDPKTGQVNVPVYTLTGGNPDVAPQSSKSLNAGVIVEPHAGALRGLRLDAEYYDIKQSNFIATLGAQGIVNQENDFPARVTRDATGRITLVDNSSVNLYLRETSGWDLSADYAIPTRVGTFRLHAAESIIQHLKSQYAQNKPSYEAAGYSPSESAPGAPKYKSNVTLDWETRRWTVGWTVRYFSSYKQFGAAGGPYSLQTYGGLEYPVSAGNTYIGGQGGDTIPSQAYHDLFLSYEFGPATGAEGRWWHPRGNLWADLTLQVGLRNVFNKAPPLDASFANNGYFSPYGDTRLRSYWISLKKAF